MFVSIALDPGSEGRARELADLLGQYGFEKIQRGLWESAFVSPDTLIRLKKDLDRATDAFDRIRIFQFPVDGTLALTSLREKKWRRMVARGVGFEIPAAPPPQIPARPSRPAGRGKSAARAGQGQKPAIRPARPAPGRRGPRSPESRP
ncbi:MAG: CRISPR-associated protein Cas2 [Treponema sp.]|nr:CRISPR-associated protein Cas2 [Treponema sp.]